MFLPFCAFFCEVRCLRTLCGFEVTTVILILIPFFPKLFRFFSIFSQKPLFFEVFSCQINWKMCFSQLWPRKSPQQFSLPSQIPCFRCSHNFSGVTGCKPEGCVSRSENNKSTCSESPTTPALNFLVKMWENREFRRILKRNLCRTRKQRMFWKTVKHVFSFTSEPAKCHFLSLFSGRQPFCVCLFRARRARAAQSISAPFLSFSAHFSLGKCHQN